MFVGSFSFIMMVLLLTIVVPLWIVFHYITRWKQMKNEEPGEGRIVVDRETLEGLATTATKLEDRVATLESLLDTEAPGWRNK